MTGTSPTSTNSNRSAAEHRVIFHLDMDAFFASIEQRDDPALLGKPVVVGSPPQQRGVVCAASYEARAFGVRSAMPSSTAHRLCPNAVFIRPRMERYKDVSRNIMQLLRQAGAVIEPVSIDEAYLDFSAEITADEPDAALFAAVPLAKSIRATIRRECRLTASIGIAANKLLAKLASDFNKPDGLTLIPERDKALFLRPLPVRALHGVGRVTEQILLKAGLPTIADVQDHPGDLRALLGSFGPVLKRHALGIDDRPLDLSDEVKSISSEETFRHDTDDRAVLRRCLREQAEEIAEKLRRRNLQAHTVQVKVRYGDFKTLSRQLTVEDAIGDERDIYRFACWLLARHTLVNRPLRLLGLGVGGLAPAGLRQMQFEFR